MKRLSFFVVLTFLSGLMLAQEQRTTPLANTASIEGIVTKEPGSQPLKKAVVQVIANDQNRGSNYTATTDSDGRFSIEKVESGDYRVYVEKTGFVEINGRGRRSEGRSLSVRSGEEIRDLLFQMLTTAVISGKLVDEDGDPMADVNVFAQRKKPGGKLETVGSERTNDRGEFRFHNLFPGQYLVLAVPPPDFRDYERQHERVSEDAGKPDLRYLGTYFPGTYDLAQASIVSVRPGDELPINLSLVPSRTYRVRGIVTGIAAGQKATVELTSAATQTIQANDAAADGRFEIRGVAPGTYVAKASIDSAGQTLMARQMVSVIAADVDGIKLTPTRSFTVDGEIRPGIWQRLGTSFRVRLRPIDASEDNGVVVGSDSIIETATVDRIGRFQWTHVRPGAYWVQLLSDDLDGYLKSVILGESEVDTGFTLSGTASLDLVVSHGGRVEGAVTDHDQPVTDARIVFVPEEKYRKARGRFAIGNSDQRGHFVVRGLAPGTYSVFAWQDLDEALYFDADFLRAQEPNATSLKIEEGSQQQVVLKLSLVGEEWR